MSKKTFLPFMAFLIIGSMSTLGCFEECQTTSIEEKNKAVVYRIHSEISNGNHKIFDEVLTPDYVRHCQAMPPDMQELHGTDVFKGFIADFLSAVPDVKDSILFVMAENDKVAYVTQMTGTQTGPMGGLPASGKEFMVVNIIIHRFEEGKIAETWVSWDNVAMLSQLGFFPPPPPAQP